MWCLIGWTAWGYEIVLPMPTRHFNDNAHVVSSGTAAELNQTLTQLEQNTSSRVMVVVYRKMESDLPIEEYTAHVAKSWGVGQYRLLNSAVLFVFAEPRQAWLQVGTGLQKALPDAAVDSIVDTILIPSLKKGEFDTGLQASVAAIVHQVETIKPAVAESKPAQRGQSRTNEVREAPPVRAAEAVSATNQINVAARVPPVVESKPPPVVSATNSVSVAPPTAQAEVAPPTAPSQPVTSSATVVKSGPAAPAQTATTEVKEVKAVPAPRSADTVPPVHRARAAATDASKGALAAYDNAVIEKVQKRWNAFVVRHGSYEKSGKVTVEFQLLDDGSIQGLKTRDETGDQTLRLYCEKAVQESAPFNPLPAELRKSSNHKPRDVEMTFQY
jgi:uncharacterized membrane protein YgcG